MSMGILPSLWRRMPIPQCRRHTLWAVFMKMAPVMPSRTVDLVGVHDPLWNCDFVRLSDPNQGRCKAMGAKSAKKIKNMAPKVFV